MMPDGVEDEEKWLSTGISGLQQNAFHMHRALDSNNLKDALKYSAQMLFELRTSRLSPHKYYELHMRAFDELRRLEMFFWEESRRGSCSSVVELYELVQHAGNILPRLFRGNKPVRGRVHMMPIGTPRVPYKTPGESTWQWVDLWNALLQAREAEFDFL